MEAVWNHQLRHVLYNLVAPSDVHLYRTEGLPSTSDNPDSSCLVPVVAVGFEDLLKRIKQQEIQSQAHALRLKECTENVDQLFTRHQVHTSVTLNELKRRHVMLVQRLLKILAQVHVLRNAGYPVRQQEEILHLKLQQLATSLNKSTRVKMIELSAKANQMSLDLPTYNITNESQMNLIQTALTEMHSGLQILTDTVIQDKKTLQDMKKFYSERKVGGI